MIRIDRMQEQDIDQVMRIDRASFETPCLRETYVEELRSCDFFVALAPEAEDRRVVGFVGGWPGADALHVTTLAVDPACRRQGIALELMLEILETGRARGARRATLEVRRGNAAARALYESLGFVIVGARPGYYLDNGEDGLILWIHDMEAPETYFRLRKAQGRLASLPAGA